MKKVLSTAAAAIILNNCSGGWNWENDLLNHELSLNVKQVWQVLENNGTVNVKAKDEDGLKNITISADWKIITIPVKEGTTQIDINKTIENLSAGWHFKVTVNAKWNNPETGELEIKEVNTFVDTAKEKVDWNTTIWIVSKNTVTDSSISVNLWEFKDPDWVKNITVVCYLNWKEIVTNKDWIFNGLDASTLYEFAMRWEAYNSVKEIYEVKEWDRIAIKTSETPDTEKPVITLNWDSEITLTVWESYTELWATATDNVDENLTVTITYFDSEWNEIQKENITEKAWTYTVKYNVSDSAGNKAEEVTRTVNVEAENQAPVINISVSTVDWYTVDTTDPYNVWADYTIDASRDLIIDATWSTDDWTITNLKITSDMAWEIYNWNLQAVQIPRQSSSTIETLTIVITDNDWETTEITKKIVRD